ncbi:hypothetical protein [Actinoplanes derwentensis]|uniref:hypothetical protein n=1 Tax=Actinoplanes derwentensis TaxID=113562 RepID=UPI000B891FB7|nr:hypothetical protein [Actinoplanes derwentensis]GID82649.1 hypothetical protein Ade03nite_15730 [Actinoplanes derwentensis]
MPELSAERDTAVTAIFGDGLIPEDDITELQSLGVAALFTPGASLEFIAEWAGADISGPDRMN